MVYDDKIEGVISHEFWQEKHIQYKAELAELDSARKAQEQANIHYLESGVALIELAKNAHGLYSRQSPHEKRRLLDIVLSNCTLEGETLHYTYKKPFDFFVPDSENEKNRKRQDSNPQVVRPTAFKAASSPPGPLPFTNLPKTKLLATFSLCFNPWCSIALGVETFTGIQLSV